MLPILLWLVLWEWLTCADGDHELGSSPHGQQLSIALPAKLMKACREIRCSFFASQNAHGLALLVSDELLHSSSGSRREDSSLKANYDSLTQSGWVRVDGLKPPRAEERVAASVAKSSKTIIFSDLPSPSAPPRVVPLRIAAKHAHATASALLHFCATAFLR